MQIWLFGGHQIDGSKISQGNDDQLATRSLPATHLKEMMIWWPLDCYQQHTLKK